MYLNKITFLLVIVFFSKLNFGQNTITKEFRVISERGYDSTQFNSLETAFLKAEFEKYPLSSIYISDNLKWFIVCISSSASFSIYKKDDELNKISLSKYYDLSICFDGLGYGKRLIINSYLEDNRIVIIVKDNNSEITIKYNLIS